MCRSVILQTNPKYFCRDGRFPHKMGEMSAKQTKGDRLCKSPRLSVNQHHSTNLNGTTRRSFPTNQPRHFRRGGSLRPPVTIFIYKFQPYRNPSFPTWQPLASLNEGGGIFEENDGGREIAKMPSVPLRTVEDACPYKFHLRSRFHPFQRNGFHWQRPARCLATPQLFSIIYYLKKECSNEHSFLLTVYQIPQNDNFLKFGNTEPIVRTGVWHLPRIWPPPGGRTPEWFCPRQ